LALLLNPLFFFPGFLGGSLSSIIRWLAFHSSLPKGIIGPLFWVPTLFDPLLGLGQFLLGPLAWRAPPWYFLPCEKLGGNPFLVKFLIGRALSLGLSNLFLPNLGNQEFFLWEVRPFLICSQFRGILNLGLF